MKMRYIIKTITFAFAAIVFAATSLNALVTAIPDWTSPSGNEEESTIGAFNTVTNSTYYISGNFEFTTTGAADDYAFASVGLSGGVKVMIGINSTSSDFLIRAYDTPTGTNNIALNGLGTPNPGDTVDFVLKVDQAAQSWTFWLNPDRALTETNQAGATVTQDLAGFSFGAVNGVEFKSGTGVGLTNARTSFTNFQVFSEGESAFAVPEPATYALIFGGLSLAYVMFRRRFKG